MKINKYLLKVCILTVIVIPILHCSKADTISDTHFEHKSGIYFEFPKGWSPIGKEEWEERNLGNNQTMITVADEEREAFFAVVPMDFDISALEVSFIARGIKKTPTGMLIEAIHQAGPSRYMGYRMIDKGMVDFAGREVGELIFEGKMQGKKHTWNQIVIAVDEKKTDRYYMLMFSVPPKKLIFFREDLEVIDKTWRWPK